MKQRYSDITSRISTPPLWWNTNGVPRYEEFSHIMRSDAYADEVALLKIACQACAKEFNVEVSWERYSKRPSMSSKPNDIWYGDPPNIGCCSIGPTMSSISLYVVQFWKRNVEGWRRCPDFEGNQMEKLNFSDLSFSIKRHIYVLMSLVDHKGRKPLPGDIITFTYWTFSDKKIKYGLVISIYEKVLMPESNKDSVILMMMLQDGRLQEYYAFSDDIIVIHTR